MQDSSFEEINKLFFMRHSATMYTCLPCVVVSVDDLARQMISVQPSINKKYKNGNWEEQAVITGVPVVFPASRTSSFTFPINVGDTVLCVFSQRGMDNFKSGTGSPATPPDFRRFSNRDAVAIPGLFPFSKAINNPARRNNSHSLFDAVIAHNIGTGGECEIRLKENGDVIIDSPTKVTVNCEDAIVNSTTVDINASTMTVDVATTTWNGNITFNSNVVLNGNLTQTGVYVLDGITFNGHVHDGVVPGVGKSGGPTN